MKHRVPWFIYVAMLCVVFACAEEGDGERNSDSLNNPMNNSVSSNNSTQNNEEPLDLDCEPVGVNRLEISPMPLIIEHPDQLLPYCGVPHLVGTMIISPTEGVGWNGLNSLSAVETWEGHLSVSNLEVSLPRLEQIGSLRLVQEPNEPPASLPALRVIETNFFPGQYTGTLDMSALESVQKIQITGAMALDSLTELFEIGGNVSRLPEAPMLRQIPGGAGFSGTFKDLALMRNVTQVGGLLIASTSLESLEDLSNLEQVGPASNHIVHSLKGLTITSTQITSLSGLENLRSIQGDIIITNNPNLTTLSGLNPESWENMVGPAGIIETRLIVRDNPQMNDISSFAWLDTIELPKPCSIEVWFGVNDSGEFEERFEVESERLAALCD